jgi:hypothetical protein
MTLFQYIIAAVVLLVLLPIGDTLNRWARSGGTYTPRLPDIRTWWRRVRVRWLLSKTPKGDPQSSKKTKV